jgi:hypothetical protein
MFWWPYKVDRAAGFSPAALGRASLAKPCRNEASLDETSLAAPALPMSSFDRANGLLRPLRTVVFLSTGQVCLIGNNLASMEIAHGRRNHC